MRPRWVPLLILAAALQPLLVAALCQWAAPAGTVATGLGIPDSAIFLQAMRAPAEDWHSPYAAGGAWGEADWRYYAVPHLWLYVLLGLLANALHLPHLLLYALANALGVAACLAAAWVLLRRLAPAHAPRAFLLFVCGGGLGGLLWWGASLSGLTQHPVFEAYFLRWGLYELMDGAHLLPVTIFPRAYYTLSLSLCLGGFAQLILAPAPRRRALLFWPPALLAGAFLNARYGLFALGLLALWQIARPAGATKSDRRAQLAYVLPILAGAALSQLLLRQNPAVFRNHLEVANMAIWFSPLLVAALPMLVAALPALRNSWRQSAPFVRALFDAAAVFLGLYAGGYLLYQGWHGNLLRGRDGSVAAAISDYALAAAVLAFAGALWQQRGRTAEGSAEDVWLRFAALWFLGFLCLGLGGFGAGWFLQFGPQRLLVLLWLPLCLLAAAGLGHWPAQARHVYTGLLLIAGVASISAATLAFQSPVGRAYARGPYAAQHTEILTLDDAALLAQLPPASRVLAPLPAGDVVVSLRGAPVSFGIGSFNLTSTSYTTLRDAAAAFFSPHTPDEERRAIAAALGAEVIWCPATWPVAEELRTQLRTAAWLRPLAETGDALLFAVKPE